MKKILLILLLLIFLLPSCSKENANNQEDVKPKDDEQKIIATWVSYYEINSLVSSSDTQLQFENNIQDKVDILKEFKINTIFLQVRAFDDCFYKSKIYPVSKYCSDDNNGLKFDVLETFIKICKTENIDVHAWINPYRISNNSDIKKLHSDSYASKILNSKTEKERLIITNDNIYYNPAYPDVQNYILDGVREILNNYNVAGIHIDDYFYPTTSTKIDSQIYKKYLNDGGNLSLNDYRRNCVNSLISSMYQIVKKYNDNIIFSISPCADFDKNYNEYYADVKLWATNKGYVDYIIPQLYYGFNHDTMPFERLLDEWVQLKDSNNKIIIGLALYKIGNIDVYAGEGENEWEKNSNIITRQIACVDNFILDGVSFFSSSYLYDKQINEHFNEEKKQIKDYIHSNW